MKRQKIKQPTILTNDPSMTAWGWAVIDYNGNVVKVGCIKTQPSLRKLRIRVGDDRVRRIYELNRELLGLIREHDVRYMLCEQPSGSKIAAGALMVGVVLAVMTTISSCTGIGVEWYSEGDAKKCISGKRSLTKEQTIKLIDKFYEVPWTGVKYVDEAVADALAIHRVAYYQSPVLRMKQK